LTTWHDESFGELTMDVGCVGSYYAGMADEGPHSDARKAHLDKIRPLGAAWHRTPEGREQARQAGHLGAEKFWEQREEVTLVCARDGCGNEFSTPYPDRARYCSEACARRVKDSQNAYNEYVQCPVCPRKFWRNKYKHTPETCSRDCGARLRRQRRAGALDRAWAESES
jgi:hypothetical protein